MIRRLLLALFLVVAASGARACTLPYTLLNGTVADATQVMANFNQVISCIGTIGPGGSLGAIQTYGSATSFTGTVLPSSDLVIAGGTTTPRGLAGGIGCVPNYTDAAHDPTCTATPTLGASGTLGSLTLGNAASGGITLQTVSGALGSSSAVFPVNTGGSAAVVAELNLPDQLVSGGFNVSSANLGTISSGTLTVDCGTVDLQYFTNDGAFTLAAPSNDGSCALQMVNGASAGAVTFSGFTVGTNTGTALDTTNGDKFLIYITRINGVSLYQTAGYQ